jgi:hypothetical protein
VREEPVTYAGAILEAEVEPDRSDALGFVDDRELCCLRCGPACRGARDDVARRQAPVVEPTLNLEIRQGALDNWNVLLGERAQHDVLVEKGRIRGAQCRHD